MPEAVLLIIGLLVLVMVGSVINEERKRRINERIAREQMEKTRSRLPWKK